MRRPEPCVRRRIRFKRKQCSRSLRAVEAERALAKIRRKLIYRVRRMEQTWVISIVQSRAPFFWWECAVAIAAGQGQGRLGGKGLELYPRTFHNRGRRRRDSGQPTDGGANFPPWLPWDRGSNASILNNEKCRMRLRRASSCRCCNSSGQPR